MARLQVHHSEDACCILIDGDRRKPEPSTAVIKFPGGHVEVTRHSDGSYWVHVGRNTRINDPDAEVLGHIVDSRIDLTYDARHAYAQQIPPLPAAEHIEHMALRIARATAITPRRDAAAPDGRLAGEAAGAGLTAEAAA